jgi:hypothetical protein
VRPFPEVDQGQWQVSRGGGAEPAWAPDGKTLYYSGPGSPGNMMAVRIQSGPTFAHGAASPPFSPDGCIFPGGNPRNYAITRAGRFVMLKDASLTQKRDERAGSPRLVLVQTLV